MPDFATTWPAYRSHWRVRAARITEVHAEALAVQADEQPLEFVRVPPNLFARYTPVPGDFLLSFEDDGFVAVSPKERFERGYTRIDEET